ncbi:MAG: hypothetical protein ABSC92_11130 [Rhizomicrobium sp.]|jgi:hypothetical protein
MRKIFLAAALLAVSTTLAFADDIMASRYGNTTISTDASGVQSKLYYAADGTFTGTQAGTKFKGTWKIDGGNVCLTTDPALPGTPNPICLPVAAHKVGDTWSSGGRTVTLVQGIQ